MKQIRFSHRNYEKFRRIGVLPPCRAKLLQVFVTSELSPAFLEYDTTYYEKEQTKRYPLGKRTKLWLVLLLEEETILGIFTTIRSHSKEKESYYRNAQGETFDIVCTQGG